MTDAERSEMVATLGQMAGAARAIAELYEEAADTVAGFQTEEEYESLAEEAFTTAQASIDDWWKQAEARDASHV